MITAARLFTFAGGARGPWRIEGMEAIAGEPLEPAARLRVQNAAAVSLDDSIWVLRGITSNERYVTQSEKQRLVAKQPALGRPEATCARMIALRKNASWWSLTQDERRSVLEERSRHIQIGLEYLPAIARRLHHCRDLGDAEPFDFLTWFEYAPADALAFDTLLAQLRATAEWTFIDREVDLRLTREAG